MESLSCKLCGVAHDARTSAFLVPLPDMLAALPVDEFSRRVERSSDQCVLDGEHFFLLGNLDVPVRGEERSVRWTVWTTLSRESFQRATELWTTPGRESEPAYFGWLSNQIPGYPQTVPLALHVHTQPVGIRPILTVLDEDHDLSREQRDGVTSERADELIHAALGE